MSGGSDIIGDLAQGALLARTVEPAHGEGDPGHTHERACLNCGTALLGSHCHACGQAAHVHRTLAAFFHDLVHGVFHFEGKIWRTLPLLAWRPGQLTREYIDGRRASYVSPIALFLFVVFLTFAVFNAVSDPIKFNFNTPGEAAAALAEAEAKVTALEAEKAAAAAKGTLEEKSPSLKASPAEIRQSSWLGPLLEAQAKARKNPELLIYKLQSNAYKFSWLLIPISIPFVWLLFPFARRFHLYDHTVFVTYSLSFLLLLLSAISLVIIWSGSDWLILVLMLYAPFHMFRQLREAYGLTRFGAWWRTWFLALFALLALVLFAVALTVLAVG
jgi:Protein of unknown function (DUF3667)